MNEDDVAAFDVAVEVVVFVDDGVELAFAADGHQAELVVVGAGECG